MTFSLVARCTTRGHLGMAVTTSSVAVGGRSAAVDGKVAAVATQNRTDPSIGPRLIAALAGGATPQAALDAVMADTVFPEWRQVAAITADGAIVTFHGAKCSGIHAEARGVDCAAVGNILANTEVPAAMVAAFERADGALEHRLLAALKAGDAAGGELKPLRSAAIRVAGAEPFPWCDLRVDAAENPIAVLDALLAEWDGVASTVHRWALDPGSV
ncbi:DUF1028 domain-containing protein [Acuticoccus mangrovi]|uniref:DUF1028 domain-containing protein n=1 Tax=Acuticoccus mangrovi TaxID=2796142 RepID=A0A934IGG0_9HYPH|nr:DUF1028 domain-containing protein [Acuticoccus mangrovi]MBJ3775998.1 DUF1028 domain-containing protein [Acuticoccus mangrovi]